MKEGRDLGLPGLLYGDNLFCVVSRRKTWAQWWEVLLVYRRGPEANAGNSKEMVLNGEEGLEGEIRVNRM